MSRCATRTGAVYGKAEIALQSSLSAVDLMYKQKGGGCVDLVVVSQKVDGIGPALKSVEEQAKELLLQLNLLENCLHGWANTVYLGVGNYLLLTCILVLLLALMTLHSIEPATLDPSPVSPPDRLVICKTPSLFILLPSSLCNL